jgi:murein L,D-transpeptidase YcbB/YkuD
MRLALLFAVLVSTAAAGRPNEQLRGGVPGAQLAATPATAAGPPNEQLQELIDSGSLSDLRWPNFTPLQPDVTRFYELNGYQLAWVASGAATPQALALIQALENATFKGLDPRDYDGSQWTVSDAGLQRFDLALTISAMRYISDVSSGKVNPKVFSFGLNFDQNKCDLVVTLRGLMNARDTAAELERLEPPFEGYWRTEKALAEYMALAREDDGELLPATKKPVEPGNLYPGVTRLERLLRLLGDFRPNDTLVDALKRFQIRHGLDPDGRLGKATLKQLNTPLAQRVRQLQLVLERWRWVPHSFPRPPIVVNIPEFRLRAYDDRYQAELEMKVVVGKAYRHKTPVFSNEMTHVIFRPYWDVPLSIQRAELVPKIAKDPAYLAENDYEIVDSRRQVVPSAVVTPDMLARLRSGKLFIRQIPGDKNALGDVKFLFPNEYNVYLHGTPAKSLFLKSRRDFSYGCIRVEKPEELAQWVLRGLPGWDMDCIREAENGTASQRVNLDKPIPVLIVYGTAVVREGGEVFFFDDIYGHDAALEQTLDHGYPYSGWQPNSAALCPRPRE